MDFHISLKARKRYQFDDSLFTFRGGVIFANFHAARIFAHRMNENRDLAVHPELAVQAGQVNAMGLISEIFHLVVSQYRTQKAPLLYENLIKSLEDRLGKRKLKSAIRLFIGEFPPQPVYRKVLTTSEYVMGVTDGIPNQAAAVEEMMMLWLTNINPACKPYQELFDDSLLKNSSAYPEVVDAIHEFFDNQPYFGPDHQNLMDMLRSPAIAVPESLKGQLDYILSRWGQYLGHYLLKLLGSLTMISEDELNHGLGPGKVHIPVYGEDSEMDYERFSPDADWMPQLVMMAKNTYVWLDQLSKKYQKSISRLDQIPNEELDQLAEWGFSGLWLIGLWERSRASAQIKKLCGNPEAIASAYSLKEYKIADDLGGESALNNLQKRAWQKGIRLASDMVPNHMAIDSTWIYDHPDWFISLPYPPFPSYSYNGENLSQDNRATIQIEDHYYDRTDAAVAFKFYSNHSNQTHYIYHGNDGTSMPWNDTAQLNYLNPEVREAVINTILEVARQFPIIRFDAAMTLARRHYQRLWFPEPGGGCDIPSRSEFGLTQAQFNQAMPEEFWREVVDRVAVESPGTLLLAEAFWLMEGYFVRTLGMHRVYNSAFMNLLRDEDNAKYRQVMKNTLEFDPEIMKRFVNFMNNPDEQTAAIQFGKGDKYFGICTLLATLPGLPMFGHGQIEGFSEKYGMEYKRAYQEEFPDPQFIDRHVWQIFPLLKRRNLFSGVDRFYLYDFFTSAGQVDENVFAYSNGNGDQSSLVIYHNRFADTTGWIRTSVAFMDKEKGKLRRVDLHTGLGIPDGKHEYVIFHDQLTGMEYIRNCSEIAKKGLMLQLDAYRAHVFTDFQIESDDQEEHWKKLHDQLNGRGTPDIYSMFEELPLRPVLQSFREIVNPGYLKFLLSLRPKNAGSNVPEFLFNEADHKIFQLLNGASEIVGRLISAEDTCRNFREKISIIFQLEWLDESLSESLTQPIKKIFNLLKESFSSDLWLSTCCWAYLDCLQSAMNHQNTQFINQISDWRFFGVIDSALWEMGNQIQSPGDLARNIHLLLIIKGWFEKYIRQSNAKLMHFLLENEFLHDFLRINEFEGKTWFGKESFETVLTLMTIEGIIEILTDRKRTQKSKVSQLEKLSYRINGLKKTSLVSEYDLNKFMEILN